MVNDWELPAEEIAKLPRPRAVTAICEGVIEEYGKKEGPGRVCLHIYGLITQHADDMAYISEAQLWSETLNAVCKRRRIRFKAETAIVDMLAVYDAQRECLDTGRGNKPVSILTTMQATVRKATQAQKKASRAFEQCVNGPLSVADMLYAHGLGIKW